MPTCNSPSPVKPFGAGKLGPACRWWLYFKKCMPDHRLSARWIFQGEGEPFAAIAILGRLLEQWEEEISEQGRGTFFLVEALNLLLKSWSINVRVKDPCKELEAELRCLAGKTKRSVLGRMEHLGRMLLGRKCSSFT